MFGYVTIYHKALSPAAQDRYQAYYCGLCRALKARYGVVGQLTLSYDMTFVTALLSALYEPVSTAGRGRCAAHPAKPRPRLHNEYIDYAADMTVALAYYNFLDDWQDEGKHSSRLLAKRLEPHLAGIRARWPAQCAAMEARLAELTALESAGSTDLDALCGCFGALLGAVLQPRQDMWAPLLDSLGRGLGGFIYLMDAYDDLEKDAKKGSFNALAHLHRTLPPPTFAQRCHDLLTQQMALCADSFAMLPILKDTPDGELLYNTLYSGVWGQYELRRAMRQKRAEKQTQKG